MGRGTYRVTQSNVRFFTFLVIGPLNKYQKQLCKPLKATDDSLPMHSAFSTVNNGTYQDKQQKKTVCQPRT